MELIMINIVSTISVLLLLIPCSSLQHQLQSSHEQASEDKMVINGPPPRKLRFTEDQVMTVKSHGDQGTPPVDHHKVTSTTSGKNHDGEDEEEAEEAEPLQFLTKDYHFVRRRRPVHNKSLPLRP